MGVTSISMCLGHPSAWDIHLHGCSGGLRVVLPSRTKRSLQRLRPGCHRLPRDPTAGHSLFTVARERQSAHTCRNRRRGRRTCALITLKVSVRRWARSLSGPSPTHAALAAGSNAYRTEHMTAPTLRTAARWWTCRCVAKRSASPGCVCPNTGS